MSKMALLKPTLILLYGFPGSGKSFLARQLCNDIHAAHVQGDRIRDELFEEPRHDKQENDIIEHLTQYMTEEFLAAGISVVYDMNAARLAQRRALRDLARNVKAEVLTIWLQVDAETAFLRSSKRDKRRHDDKYATKMDRGQFESAIARMQNPDQIEDFMVISGKHNYQTQRSAIIKRLYDSGLINPDEATNRVVKPGLVNLIPSKLAGRVDEARRNIMIR